MLIKHGLVSLEDIWAHLESPLPEEMRSGEKPDEIQELLDKQQASLEYQYSMLYKTIMN